MYYDTIDNATLNVSVAALANCLWERNPPDYTNDYQLAATLRKIVVSQNKQREFVDKLLRVVAERMITDEVWINNNYWNVTDATPRETALAFYLTMTDKD